MGIKWATVDDGYQIAEGDWELDTKRFPGGDRDMVDLVKKMKAYGLKVQLWWAPLAADPGTKVLKENPVLLRFPSNRPRIILLGGTVITFPLSIRAWCRIVEIWWIDL